MALLIYADESGDLGFSFEQPYGKGGSSRYLTIFACFFDESIDHLPKRVMRNVYKGSGWHISKEKKWTDAPKKARAAFANAAANLLEAHPEIGARAIVVHKERARAAIRRDPNILYNFLFRKLLIDVMAEHQQVVLIPDNRSVKVESGNSLHEYLETTLLFELNVDTRLETIKRDSGSCLNIQFADMMAGIVQSSLEFGRPSDVANWKVIEPFVKLEMFNT